MKLLALLPFFLAATLANENTDCKSCFPATSSDCVDASGQIPTDGSTLDDNSNTLWTSGSCTIEFIPNGGSPDGNDVLGVAQSFLSDCCSGDSCSGVAYDTGSSTALQNGCLCFHEEGKTPCTCGAGTPSMTCI
ncbi:hypothetical protein N7509_005620 [Penicillium cosmopolitanum]|uniref:EGF-like domain-containing protein n=1 Tax=Penicillium cosmopolitanum TaxID=1131564 RepID=A0A9W9W2U5_9EURO|nr:uncharacterized protein N7509_005620 [Penicillium cosmopolitanum]KAJ5397507.1 hypothetical protein N7509_005620 [Penicillium cosmopolitanum]